MFNFKCFNLTVICSSKVSCVTDLKDQLFLKRTTFHHLIAFVMSFNPECHLLVFMDM